MSERRQDCGCCAGVDAATPRRVSNPPGLPAVHYRPGRHGDFLESVLARLSSASYPALSALKTREASDFTIALSDALAAHLDVLSFYAERYANEHYLRTATERLSVLEMARLIGYELAPGVAAGTHLAFTLQDLPGAAAEPITIPVGTRVQSVPGQDEDPQIFETIAAQPARVEWNALAPQQTAAPRPAAGDTGLWLAGTDTGLEAGDRILIVGDEYVAGGPAERWASRIVARVTTDEVRGLSQVAWRKPLGSDRDFALGLDEGALVYAFRARSPVFGHGATDWRALSEETKASYLGLPSGTPVTDPEDLEEWPEFTIYAPLYPPQYAGDYAIEAVHTEATLEEITAAATSGASSATAEAFYHASQAGAGVVAAGAQIGETAVTLARQSAEGLGEVAQLAVDEVTGRARQLIDAQGQSLQALRLSADQLIQHVALDRARQIVGQTIGGLPARIAALAEQGVIETRAAVQAVLTDLRTSLNTEVPAALLPDLSSAWQTAAAAIGDAVSEVEEDVGDDSSPLPSWLAVGDTAYDGAVKALGKVSDAIDPSDIDFDEDGETAAVVLKDVVEKLAGSIGETLSGESLGELMSLTSTPAGLQDWIGNLLESGGALGEGLLRLQASLTGTAGALFARLGQDLAGAAEDLRSAVADTGAILNPAAALGALGESANALRTNALEAGVATTSAAAAAELGGAVTAAVAIAQNLPAPFAPTTAEEMAAVVRHFAGAAVARAGGSPLIPLTDSETMAQIEALLPPPLQGPTAPDVSLLEIVEDADALLNAPRAGAEAAYETIVARVDAALDGTLVHVLGRRPPLRRYNDRIDLSPVNEDVLADTWTVLSTPADEDLFGIVDVTTASRSEYLASGQTTRLQLHGPVPGDYDDVRGLSAWVESEALALAGRPLTVPVYGSQLPLDGHVDDLAPGAALALSGQRPRIRLARRADHLSLTAADGTSRPLTGDDSLRLLSAPVRLLGTTPAYLDPPAFAAAIGDGAVSLRLQLEDRDGLTGHVVLQGDEFALEPPAEDDPLIREVVFLVTTEEAVTHDRDRSVLRLAEPAMHCYDRLSARINANVAPATHGESVETILGGGDGSRTDQEFALNQSPLTYVSADTASGRASTLEVRINDVLWAERNSLYAAGPEERTYETRRSDDGVTTIQFGDGAEGARLPSGTSNVRARYRKFLGIDGNVGGGKLTTLLSRPLGVSEVVNPVGATGGEDPESLDRARDNAPLTVLTLDRAVSIDDYADFARAFAGIDKAHALWIPTGPARGVFLTIAGIDGAPVPADSDTWRNLDAALGAYGDPLVPLQLGDYADARFACRASVKVGSDYETEPVLAAAREALREHFGFAARRFGQPVSVDEVAAVIQARPGVEAVHVDRLHRTDAPASLEPRLFAALPAITLTGQPAPAELLTLAEGPVELEVMP